MAFLSFLQKLKSNGIRHYSHCICLNDVYIISAVRTPIGIFQGSLSSLSATQLGSEALTAAIERSHIPKEEITELILGCACHAGLGQGPARQIALFSGMPASTICSTVNKICGSGCKAIFFGCQVLTSLSQEAVAIVGAESLSNAPYILRRKNLRMGTICLPDTLFHDLLIDVYDQVDVTYFAEQTCKEFNITKDDQDDYALNSYSRTMRAQQEGHFAAEMVPITIKRKGKEDEVMYEDEEPKRLKIDKFRNLQPDLKGGSITVGNSSNLNDGAAALILASGNFVLKKSLVPLARVVAFADGAVEPKNFCIAPSVAIPKALVRANLNADAISMWEISETFAVTVLANTKILKLDPEKVNMHGGAISLGHPFGMTGVRIVVHLTHALQPGQYGCAAISHATGGGGAIIIEKL